MKRIVLLTATLGLAACGICLFVLFFALVSLGVISSTDFSALLPFVI